jgi:protein O-GlcNAc transferase
VHSFKLMILNYISGDALTLGGDLQRLDHHLGEEITSDAVYEEHARWGEMMMQRYQHVCMTSFPNSKDPDRVLKIGYVSGDLLSPHAVARFADHVLARHDRTQLHVSVFLTRQRQPAAHACADCLVDISLMGSEMAAKTVLSREIDILVDLAGHSANNRLY